MIVYKQWTKKHRGLVMKRVATFEGWFLFGVIPLYIRQTSQWKETIN